MYLTVEEARKRYPGADIGAGRKNVSSAIAIHSSGNYPFTAFSCEDGIIITLGCMNEYRGDTPENTRKWVSENYADKLILFDLALAFASEYFKK